MKYLLLATMLVSVTSNAKTTKYVGKIESNSKECTLSINERKKDFKLKAYMSSKKLRASFKISKDFYQSKVEEGEIRLVKGGMSELCDYMDICIFDKKLRKLEVRYNSDNTPLSYDLSVGYMMVDEVCTNLKKVK